VTGSAGEEPLSVARDRVGSFEPELVKKGQTRIDGVDDKIIGLYGAGLSVRDIQAHLEDLCGLRVSPGLISGVTDAVLGEIREWQHRALDRVLRKTLKTKGSFPTEKAATKLICLAIRNFEKGGCAVREWVAARNQLAIMFAGHFDT
jgi:transposase-like protein